MTINTERVREREKKEKRRVFWYPKKWNLRVEKKAKKQGLSVTGWIKSLIQKDLGIK